MDRVEQAYVVEVDEVHCNGCRDCLHVCSFGALIWMPSDRAVLIDTWACTGCGSCLTACPTHALTMGLRAGS